MIERSSTIHNTGWESIPLTGAPDGQMTPLEMHQNQGVISPDQPGRKLERIEPHKDNIEQHIPNGRSAEIDQGGVD